MRSAADVEEIRRLRKHLIWASVVTVILVTFYFWSIFADAFLAGLSEPQPVSMTPVGIIYLWLALIGYRLAKVLEPSSSHCWVVAALMFLPYVNLIVIISLVREAGQALAGPRLHR
jgi:quinol-cytochrome oxidoreductase complex cytochrome b subunit